MKYLSLVVDDELYAVDVTEVMKVVYDIPYTPVPAAPDAIIGIASLKGGVVTLLSLSVLLGRKHEDKPYYAVVFKPFLRSHEQIGVLIDKPGNLVTIEENDILPPNDKSDEPNPDIITGLSEMDGCLYRIIRVESIMSAIKAGVQNINDTTIQGGIDS